MLPHIHSPRSFSGGQERVSMGGAQEGGSHLTSPRHPSPEPRKSTEEPVTALVASPRISDALSRRASASLNRQGGEATAPAARAGGGGGHAGQSATARPWLLEGTAVCVDDGPRHRSRDEHHELMPGGEENTAHEPATPAPRHTSGGGGGTRTGPRPHADTGAILGSSLGNIAHGTSSGRTPARTGGRSLLGSMATPPPADVILRFTRPGGARRRTSGAGPALATAGRPSSATVPAPSALTAWTNPRVSAARGKGGGGAGEGEPPRTRLDVGVQQREAAHLAASRVALARLASETGAAGTPHVTRVPVFVKSLHFGRGRELGRGLPGRGGAGGGRLNALTAPGAPSSPFTSAGLASVGLGLADGGTSPPPPPRQDVEEPTRGSLVHPTHVRRVSMLMAAPSTSLGSPVVERSEASPTVYPSVDPHDSPHDSDGQDYVHTSPLPAQARAARSEEVVVDVTEEARSCLPPSTAHEEGAPAPRYESEGVGEPPTAGGESGGGADLDEATTSTSVTLRGRPHQHQHQHQQPPPPPRLPLADEALEHSARSGLFEGGVGSRSSLLQLEGSRQGLMGGRVSAPAARSGSPPASSGRRRSSGGRVSFLSVALHSGRPPPTHTAGPDGPTLRTPPHLTAEGAETSGGSTLSPGSLSSVHDAARRRWLLVGGTPQSPWSLTSPGAPPPHPLPSRSPSPGGGVGERGAVAPFRPNGLFDGVAESASSLRSHVWSHPGVAGGVGLGTDLGGGLAVFDGGRSGLASRVNLLDDAAPSGSCPGSARAILRVGAGGGSGSIAREPTTASLESFSCPRPSQTGARAGNGHGGVNAGGLMAYTPFPALRSSSASIASNTAPPAWATTGGHLTSSPHGGSEGSPLGERAPAMDGHGLAALPPSSPRRTEAGGWRAATTTTTAAATRGCGSLRTSPSPHTITTFSSPPLAHAAGPGGGGGGVGMHQIRQTAPRLNRAMDTSASPPPPHFWEDASLSGLLPGSASTPRQASPHLRQPSLSSALTLGEGTAQGMAPPLVGAHTATATAAHPRATASPASISSMGAFIQRSGGYPSLPLEGGSAASLTSGSAVLATWRGGAGGGSAPATHSRPRERYVLLTMTDGRQVLTPAPRPPSAASDDGFSLTFTGSPCSGPTMAEGGREEGGAAEMASARTLTRRVYHILSNRRVRRVESHRWQRSTAFVHYTTRSTGRGRPPRYYAQPAHTRDGPTDGTATPDCEVVADELAVDGEWDGDSLGSSATAQSSYASSLYARWTNNTDDDDSDDAVDARAAHDRERGGGGRGSEVRPVRTFYRYDPETHVKVGKTYERLLRWHHHRRRPGCSPVSSPREPSEGALPQKLAKGARYPPGMRGLTLEEESRWLLLYPDIDSDALGDVDNRLRGWLGLKPSSHAREGRGDAHDTAAPPLVAGDAADDGEPTTEVDALLTLVPEAADLALRTSYQLMDYYAACPICDPAVVLPISTQPPARREGRLAEMGLGHGGRWHPGAPDEAAVDFQRLWHGLVEHAPRSPAREFPPTPTRATTTVTTTTTTTTTTATTTTKTASLGTDTTTTVTAITMDSAAVVTVGRTEGGGNGESPALSAGERWPEHLRHAHRSGGGLDHETLDERRRPFLVDCREDARDTRGESPRGSAEGERR